jgi:hypothetical protein
LSANAQIAANSKRNIAVRSATADLDDVISKILSVFPAKL